MKLSNLTKYSYKKFPLYAKNVTTAVQEDGSRIVKETLQYRIPDISELMMERINEAWRFYTKKFIQSPKITGSAQKLSSTGDIQISGELKVLLDMKEAMEDSKASMSINDMIIHMRKMYAMLQLMGYKRPPHPSDEYGHIDMTEQAKRILEQYKIL